MEDYTSSSFSCRKKSKQHVSKNRNLGWNDLPTAESTSSSSSNTTIRTAMKEDCSLSDQYVFCSSNDHSEEDTNNNGTYSRRHSAADTSSMVETKVATSFESNVSSFSSAWKTCSSRRGSHIHKLHLPYHGIRDDQMMELSTQVLARMRMIHNNENNNNGIEKLSSSPNKIESEINLSWNNFGPQGIETFFHQFQQQEQQNDGCGSSTIMIQQHLDLKHNDIGRGMGSKAIASYFYNTTENDKNSNKNEEDENECFFQDENDINLSNTTFRTHAPLSCASNKPNSIIKSLDLSNTNIHVGWIAQSIHYSTTLESLWLDGNQLSTQDIKAIRDMLQVNKTLKTLSLRNCQFVVDNCYNNGTHKQKEDNDNRCCGCCSDHDEEEEETLRMTSSWSSLLQLGNIFAIELATGLCCNSTLEELDISWNSNIPSKGMEVLLSSALRCSGGLQKLHLQGTDVNDTSMIHLCRILQGQQEQQQDPNTNPTTSKTLSPPSLRILNVSGNHDITDRSVNALVDMLKSHPTLEELYMSSIPRISTKGHLQIIQHGLASNYTLRTYQIDYCHEDHEHQLVLRSHVDFYIKLNRIGRKQILLDPNTIPLPLWSTLLERIKNDPSCMYYLLRENPSLLMLA